VPKQKGDNIGLSELNMIISILHLLFS